jgi:hypothetical protein
VTLQISIRRDQTTVEDIWDYYGTVRDNIVRSAEDAKQDPPEGTGLQDPRLFGSSLGDIESLLEEADKQASFFIIAAAEAGILVDFYRRVAMKKPKDSVTRAFRNIRNAQDKGRARLEDILDTWAAEIPMAKADIRLFKGALRFRHWLAHGRYWVPKFGRTFDPTALVGIVTRLFDKIGVDND